MRGLLSGPASAHTTAPSRMRDNDRVVTSTSLTMRVFRQFLFILACLGVTASALAGPTVRASGPSILVNEIEVVRLRAFGGGQSPEQRAGALAATLESFLTSGSASAASVLKEAQIRVGARPWMTVSLLEAKAAGQTPISLARAWASGINAAVSLPAVKLASRNVKAPAGGSRTIALSGSMAQFANAVSADPTIVKATRTGATISVFGVSPGKAQVTVSAGTVTTTLDVVVQPLAADFP